MTRISLDSFIICVHGLALAAPAGLVRTASLSCSNDESGKTASPTDTASTSTCRPLELVDAEESGGPHLVLVILDSCGFLHRNEILGPHFTGIGSNAHDLLVEKVISKQAVRDTSGKRAVTFDTGGHLCPQSRRQAPVKLNAAMSRGRDNAIGYGMPGGSDETGTKRFRSRKPESGGTG